MASKAAGPVVAGMGAAAAEAQEVKRDEPGFLDGSKSTNATASMLGVPARGDLTFQLSGKTVSISVATYSKHVQVLGESMLALEDSADVRALLQTAQTSEFDAQLAVLATFIPHTPHPKPGPKDLQHPMHHWERFLSAMTGDASGPSLSTTLEGVNSLVIPEGLVRSKDVAAAYLRIAALSAIVCSYPGYQEFDRDAPQRFTLKLDGFDFSFNRSAMPVNLAKPKAGDSATRAEINAVTFTFMQTLGLGLYSKLTKADTSFRTIYVAPFAQDDEDELMKILVAPAAFNLHYNEKFMPTVTQAALLFQKHGRDRFLERSGSDKGSRLRLFCDTIYKSAFFGDKIVTMGLISSTAGADSRIPIWGDIKSPPASRQAPKWLREMFVQIAKGQYDSTDDDDFVALVRNKRAELVVNWAKHYSARTERLVRNPVALAGSPLTLAAFGSGSPPPPPPGSV